MLADLSLEIKVRERQTACSSQPVLWRPAGIFAIAERVIRALAPANEAQLCY